MGGASSFLGSRLLVSLRYDTPSFDLKPSNDIHSGTCTMCNSRCYYWAAIIAITLTVKRAHDAVVYAMRRRQGGLLEVLEFRN